MLRSDSVWKKYHTAARTEYPDGSMTAFLRETAKAHPDRIALEYYGLRISFRRLMARIDRCAAGLQAAGIGPGDTVSVVLPNLPQALISFYAINRLGAVANMLHPSLSGRTLWQAVQSTESRALIILDSVYAGCCSSAPENRAEIPVFLVSARAVLPLQRRGKIRPCPRERWIHSWHRLLQSGAHPVGPDTGKAEAVAAILYSGGTDGEPKAVALTNRNFNCLAVQLYDVYEPEGAVGVRALAVMPVFHAFGLGVCVHGMLCNALCVFPVPEYRPDACARLIFRRKIGFLLGVPAFFEAFSRAAELETKNGSFIKLVASAGDRMTPALRERLNRKLKEAGSDARVREAYGLTECTAGCCIDPFFHPKPGSIGFPFADTLMQIVRPDTDESLPDGEAGEICVSGPTVMAGYRNASGEGAAVLRRHGDGRLWLHTGDLGYRDAEGYYFYLQRLSRMIITAGYNVYPAALEKRLMETGLLRECCVVGQTDRALGQRVCAFVVLKNPKENLENAGKILLAACRDGGAAYEVPARVSFLDRLPRTELGKPDFHRLEEEYNIGG